MRLSFSDRADYKSSSALQTATSGEGKSKSQFLPIYQPGKLLKLRKTLAVPFFLSSPFFCRPFFLSSLFFVERLSDRIANNAATVRAKAPIDLTLKSVAW